MKADYVITAGEAARACGGRIICGDTATVLGSISTDSRDLGRDCLFIPLAGEKFDGHDFIPALAEGGLVRAVFVMKDGFEELARRSNIVLVRCDDTLRALGSLAAAHRLTKKAQVIAITGTNGKTTTKELLGAMLQGHYRTLRNEKNYNNEIGVPFTVLGLADSHEMAVLELGMNHRGEIERLSRIVRPHCAVITNVGEGHLEFLGTVENVARAKSEIFAGMERGSTVFVNAETECLDIVTSEARERGCEVRTFGLTDRAHIRPESYRLQRDRVEITYRGENIGAPLYGIHNVYNLMAAVAVAEKYDISIEEIKKSLLSFNNVDGRSQMIDRGYVLINDTYNSNPLSSRYALKSVSMIFPERRKVAVLSDMKELGDGAERFHAEIGRAVGENGFDLLCAWGSMAADYVKGAGESGMTDGRAREFESKDDMVRFLKGTLTEHDVVLVKGSRSMKMEEIIQALSR
ncbi:MAG: UDP-N-acetylmuramoyl-tripeptide--D-alanyl-D-alanine ligase [Spirochaetae bacterium HGW-Spirochaetae-1]|jgi:UDP-N-acetylmuramoyl-tripeptide--D-alanyl-D-alanine ligase|nr:MAG: UDP-N-acetylmuramoyl-tripeptide--D-alanyl-D-alanine ligase [Spirochaetae bacterium HGW-Spirochaetae-1]